MLKVLARSTPRLEVRRRLFPLHSHTLTVPDLAGRPMIAFARIITDYVTFGYLTDVYVSTEYQGKGLGRWMMQCLDEVISAWPAMRRFMILTGSPDAIRLYENTLGARDIRQSGTNLVYMEKVGPGINKKTS